MEIEFSEHAKEQLKRRRIEARRVVETIKTGKGWISFKDRKVYKRNYGQKTLEVVAIEEEDKLIIITGYYLYEN